MTVLKVQQFSSIMGENGDVMSVFIYETERKKQLSGSIRLKGTVSHPLST